MAWNDLITNARARVALPSAAATGTDDTSINTLITVASLAITKHCKRQFVSQTYDELYDGRGDRGLYLRNYPLISVESVRYRPVTVMKVTNNTLANVQARVSVTSTGLKLVSVNAGVKTTVTAGLTFSGNVSLTALVAAVNAVGNGWSAQVVGDGTNYGGWPSADLYVPNGISGTNDPGVEGQGALQCVAGSFAELKMHTYELQGWQPNTRQGWLLRAIPYTDPELLHPEDLIWPIGINNFRIQYTAGFATIPDDVQEACAQLVAYHFRLGPRETPNVPIPGAIAQYLSNYKTHTLTIPGG